MTDSRQKPQPPAEKTPPKKEPSSLLDVVTVLPEAMGGVLKGTAAIFGSILDL